MFTFLSHIRRIWWQITASIAVNFPFLGHLTFAWCPAPVLNCYACPLAQVACPIGSLQHFLVVGTIPFFVLGMTALFGALAGRFYCSHLCPFGFFQDLLAKIPLHKFRIPAWTGYGKYVSLVALVLIMPLLVKEPFFCTLCPAGSLEAGIPIATQAWLEKQSGAGGVFGADFGILGMIGWWFWFKLSLLAALIGTAMVIRRPFCRMICPLGALFGLFNRVSLLVHPPRSDDGKIRLYLRDCPVHINRPEHVNSHHCIKCRECYKGRNPESGIQNPAENQKMEDGSQSPEA